jgi:predicted phage tail protein
MKTRLMTLLALLCVSLSYAATPITADATLTWIAPTTNTDGTPLTNLSWFNIWRGPNSEALSVITHVNANVTTYKDTALAAGEYFWRVTAVNSESVESAPSELVTLIIGSTVPKTQPAPPPSLKVTSSGTTVAYKMRQEVDAFTMVAIGTVAPGTQCKSATVGAYNVVPRSAVALATNYDTLPLIVYAQCGESVLP